MAATKPTPFEVMQACDRPDGHQAHMALNGECPWCGAYDPDQIDEHADLEDFG